jgi:uncharacterized membrane protein YoaK (UPF0700 family)
MVQHSRGERSTAILLALLAGFVDAVAFLELGGYFVSFMTGNTTRMGASIMEAPALALLPLALIVIFVAGVMLGTTTRLLLPSMPRRAVMLLVSLMLFASVILFGLGIHWPDVALMALAMGAENAVFERDGEVSIGVTYMTGTLVKLGQRIVGALTGQGAPFAWVWYLMLWLGLACGAVGGAVAYAAVGPQALWIPVLGALLIAAIFQMSALDPHHHRS